VIEGIFKVCYRMPKRTGSCICVLKSGQIAGGGGLMHYTGTYEQRGRQITCEVHARKHANSTETLFDGIEEFHIQFDGTVRDGYGQMNGVITEIPDAQVQASISRLSMM
jgi:hypothetical protein